MKVVEVRRADGATLCRAQVADSFLTRGWGLLGRRSLDPGAGLLIERTNSVHTMFMRFPIDVLYLDQDNVVLKVAPMGLFRFSLGGRKAKRVLELASGAGAGLSPGERLTIEAVP